MEDTLTKREFTPWVGADGKLPEALRKTIADLIARVPGKRIRISICHYKKRRSENQNAFYFGVVVPLIRQMLNDTGNDLTPDETHDYIKSEIWKHIKTVILPDGSRKETADTSTNLSIIKWEENIEKTRAWAAQWGLILPFPNETGDYYEKMYQVQFNKR